MKLSEAKALPAEIVNVACLVNKVTLANVPETLENADKAIDYLKQLEANQTSLILKDVKMIEKTNLSIKLMATVTGN